VISSAACDGADDGPLEGTSLGNVEGPMDGKSLCTNDGHDEGMADGEVETTTGAT
jgi:hypothetical protein